MNFLRLSGVAAGMAVVVAFLAVIASSSPYGAGISDPETASVLRKTVFSSKLRVVFPVGLEGTGHNYLVHVNDDMYKKNSHLVRLPTFGGMPNFHIRSCMGGDAQHYRISLQGATSELRKRAKLEAELPPPGAMNFVYPKMSYPSGYGVDKGLRYVDLRMLAGVAEAVGLDFRVVYLRRPAKAILLADTVHRRFQDGLGNTARTNPEQRYMEYMQILLTDIAVMHSFLAELDPAFVICHEFNRTGEIKQSSLIADFLAPNVHIAEQFQKSLISVAVAHGVSQEPLPYANADVIAARLQRKLDAFEPALCNSAR